MAVTTSNLNSKLETVSAQPTRKTSEPIQDYAIPRKRMVERLSAHYIRDIKVLEAMRTVPRRGDQNQIKKAFRTRQIEFSVRTRGHYRANSPADNLRASFDSRSTKTVPSTKRHLTLGLPETPAIDLKFDFGLSVACANFRPLTRDVTNVLSENGDACSGLPLFRLRAVLDL